jgi:Tol biopolymer transport system component
MDRRAPNRWGTVLLAIAVAGLPLYLLFAAFSPKGQERSSPRTSVVSAETTRSVYAVYSHLGGSGNADNSEIYLTTAQEEFSLAPSPGADHSPSLSPDGRRVAFASERAEAGNLDIFVADLDGSNVVRVTSDPEIDTEPRWSPDGSQIVFARADGAGHWEIYSVRADGSGETKLTDNDVSDESPAWSPDGRQIAFQRYVGSNLEIFVMNADGSDETQLTSQAGEDRRPVWSPDGTQIAFVRDAAETGASDIFVMNADGSHIRRLTADPGADERPIWSADGAKILFYRQATDTGEWSPRVVEVASGDEASISDPSLSAALNRVAAPGRILGLDVHWGSTVL